MQREQNYKQQKAQLQKQKEDAFDAFARQVKEGHVPDEWVKLYDGYVEKISVFNKKRSQKMASFFFVIKLPLHICNGCIVLFFTYGLGFFLHSQRLPYFCFAQWDALSACLF